MCLGLMLLSPSQTSQAADDQRAQAVVDRMARLFSSTSSIATATMQISNEDGQRNVSMKIWSLGAENVLLRINSPQEEAGTAILRVRRRYLVLPAESEPHGEGASFHGHDLLDGK